MPGEVLSKQLFGLFLIMSSWIEVVDLYASSATWNKISCKLINKDLY